MFAFEFDTRKTTYKVAPIGFGLIGVQRTPRDVYVAPECVTTGVQTLVVDDITVHPVEPGGSVLEARQVIFWLDGKAVFITSSGDSRTIDLEWGSYEQAARVRGL